VTEIGQVVWAPFRAEFHTFRAIFQNEPKKNDVSSGRVGSATQINYLELQN